MIEGLRRYEHYKPSGQPWLGDVPAHWDIKPNRALFSEVKDRDSAHEEMLSVTIARGVIRQKALLKDTSKKDGSRKDRSAYKLVRPGDIAYNKMRAWQGSVGVSAFRGIVSPAYVVMRPRHEHSARYFHELFRTPAFAKEAERWSYGITSDMWSLRPEHFKMIWSALPPADEQAAIIRFLDHANLRIESYIHGKRKLIALLNEQKQAIIDLAVTRGLDPNAPMKDSGVPWLGEVPARWVVAPLKSVSVVQSGVTLGKSYAKHDELTELPYLRVANVQSGRLDLRTVKKLRLPPREAQRSLLQTGDVLMTEGGDPDKLGRGCIWTGAVTPCLHQNHVFAVRPILKRLLPEFLSAVLGSGYAKQYFLRTAKQTTNLASTNKTTIGQFRVPLPELPEQATLLRGLNTLLGPVELAIAQAAREIALMREYRTRLVSDVVTGQLDVRAAAQNLPPEEPAPVHTDGEDEALEEDETPEEDAVA